jgi:integrase
LRRYSEAKDLFVDWLEMHGAWPTELGGYDDLVCEYLEELWEQGQPKALGGNTLSALQHFAPGLKGKLVAAWRLYGAWSKSEIPLRAPPMLKDVMLGLAGKAYLLGQPRVGICIVLGFQALLRTGELCSLKVRDVRFGTATALLHLGFTKSGHRRGEEETVICDDPVVVAELRRLLAGLPGEETVLGVAGPRFRVIFASLVSGLTMPHARLYRPYSLRRGGATFLYEVSSSLSAVTTRGRWSSSQTARQYINQASAEAQRQTLGPRDAALLRTWQKHLPL